MKNILISFVSLLFLSSTVNAQMLIRDFVDLMEEWAVFNRSGINMPDYTGEPFLNSEFSEGTITTSEGIIYEKVPLRYNIYNDIFDFEKDGVSYTVDPVKYGLRVSIGSRQFVWVDHNYNNIINKGYLELLETGGYSLYKKYKVRYDRPQPAGAYSDSKPGNFFKLPFEYFLQELESGDIMFIPNEGKLLELCGIHQQEVKAYIKEKRLKFRKENDLLEIVKFLNSL